MGRAERAKRLKWSQSFSLKVGIMLRNSDQIGSQVGSLSSALIQRKELNLTNVLCC